MKKILVSACLLGCKVRYNGCAVNVDSSHFEALSLTYELVPFCPEVQAGLPTPRPAAEIQGGAGDAVLQGAARVVGIDNIDVSDYFCRGAQMALTCCVDEEIEIAILNESSPSCGSSRIYDGHFNGKKKAGMGVTAALLDQHGVRLYSQHNIVELLKTEQLQEHL